MFSMAEDLTSYVPCQKRSNIRSERGICVPFARRVQLSAQNSESLQKDDESSFVEGLFTPLNNTLLLDQKLKAFDDISQFQSPFDQQGMLTEQCFSELIKSGLNLPPLTARNNSSFLNDPLSTLDCTNFENNNTAGLYSDSGFYDCGKDLTVENASLLSTIGEECKDGSYSLNVLKAGTKSYEDFKSKEFRTKIERNFSSPVLSSQSPVTDCGRLSVGSNPTVSKTNHPILDCVNCHPDAEDLEVAMINQSFEEQQKQTKIFENAAIKNYFYSHPNKTVDSSGLCTNLNSSMSHASSDEKTHERMPYTVAITNNKKHVAYKESDSCVQQCSSSMNASLTMSEDDMTVKKTDLSDLSEPELSSIRSRPYDSIYHRTSLDSNDCSRRMYEDNEEQKLSDFDVEEMILDDAALRRAAQSLSSGRYNLGEHIREPALTESRRDFVKTKKERSASDAIPIRSKKQAQPLMGSAEEKLDATAAIALTVVESLFVGGNSLDHSSPQLFPAAMREDSKRDIVKQSSQGSIDGDDRLAPAVQNVFDLYNSSMKQSDTHSNQSDCISPDVDPEILKAINEAASSAQASPLRKIEDAVVVPSCDSAVDSWEELDSDDSKLVDEIQSAMGKVRIRKPKIDYFAPPETVDTEWNEKELPNVLEAYGLPPRITYDDIKHELAKFDCADVTFHKVDDSHCLIAFSSANTALKALIAARQRSACPWLRLRSMYDASVAAQEKARSSSASLKPYKPRPQTTTLVARRLVENALGKRSNVSVEQRRAERKLLNDARVQKEARAALWEDVS